MQWMDVRVVLLQAIQKQKPKNFASSRVTTFENTRTVFVHKFCLKVWDAVSGWLTSASLVLLIVVSVLVLSLLHVLTDLTLPSGFSYIRIEDILTMFLPVILGLVTLARRAVSTWPGCGHGIRDRPGKMRTDAAVGLGYQCIISSSHYKVFFSILLLYRCSFFFLRE